MKYKRGKGRRPRRQQGVFCRKTGGGKFTFLGGRKLSPFGNPVPVGMTSNDRARDNLQNLGFRVGGDK